MQKVCKLLPHGCFKEPLNKEGKQKVVTLVIILSVFSLISETNVSARSHDDCKNY
jgi:hypothetical protein